MKEYAKGLYRENEMNCRCRKHLFAESRWKRYLMGALFFGILLSGCVSTPYHEGRYPLEPVSYQPPTKLVPFAEAGSPHEFAPDEADNPERVPIDLVTVLRLARDQNLDIAFMRQKVREAYADLLLTQEQFLPTITVGALEVVRHEGETQGTEGEFLSVDKQRLMAGGGLSWNLDVGETVFETLAARQRYSASQAGLEAQEELSALAAVEQYMGLVEASAQVNISLQAVRISERLVRQTQAAVDLGRGFRGDVLRARARLSRNELRLRQAREALDRASDDLVEVLHLDPKLHLIPVDPGVAAIQLIGNDEALAGLLNQAISNRPEMRQAHAMLESYAELRRAARWGPAIPSLQANIRAGGFGPNFGDLDDTEDYEFSLGWKLGPGGLFDLGRTERAEARFRLQEIQYSRTYQQLTQEVSRAFHDLKHRGPQLSVARKAVEEAEESLQLFEQRQKQGVGLPLEVIEAEETLTEARRDLVSTISAFNTAQYRVYHAVGNDMVPPGS